MILSIVNQKGGVGKTTTAVNLAHWFALKKRRVLLIDFDVQGHAGRSLGIGKASGLFRWLVDEQPIDAVANIARIGQELRVIRSDKSTEKIKLHLGPMIGREYYIAQRMEDAAGQFDLIVLDLAPGSDLLHVGALIASDCAIIPAKMDFLALDGVMEVVRTVRSLGQVRGVEPPQLIGVLPTMYDRTTSETIHNLQRLREAIGDPDLVLPPIPMDTRIREASSRGLTIWEYAPNSPAAVGYVTTADSPNGHGRVGGYLHLCEIVERMMK